MQQSLSRPSSMDEGSGPVGSSGADSAFVRSDLAILAAVKASSAADAAVVSVTPQHWPVTDPAG